MKFFSSRNTSCLCLGTPFLAAVSPHGSTKISPEQEGYFITISRQGKMIKLPFISTPQCTDSVEINLLKRKRIQELKGTTSVLRIEEQYTKTQSQRKLKVSENFF
jgi:hypothetical protein